MKYRTLGTTTTLIPAIGQGTAEMGGYFSTGATCDAECVRFLRLGIDLGMSLIDTAEIYGKGHSEELVGEAVQGVRDRVLIATKFSPGNSAFEKVIKAAEASLRRLKTDWIDLYQVHWPNLAVPLEETMRALEKLVKDGKVRYIGLSNFSVSGAQRAQSCLSSMPLVSMQQEYNLLDRTVEQSVIPFCREGSLTLIAYSPLLRGKLAPDDKRKAILSEIAVKYNITGAQLILSWLLQDSCVVAIPKTSNEKHIRENASVLDCQIDLTDYEKISELYKLEISHIPIGLIKVTGDANQNAYQTLEEAIENRFNFVPSPLELAEQITLGEFLKPIKLRLDADERYQLIEGRFRYWAWVISHGGQVPIPALIERKDRL